jgi:hypothetical protein
MDGLCADLLATARFAKNQNVRVTSRKDRQLRCLLEKGRACTDQSAECSFDLAPAAFGPRPNPVLECKHAGKMRKANYENAVTTIGPPPLSARRRQANALDSNESD